MTKLHSNVSSLSRIGGEIFHNFDETFEAIRNSVPKKKQSWKSAYPSHHRRENSPEALHKKNLGKI